MIRHMIFHPRLVLAVVLVVTMPTASADAKAERERLTKDGNLIVDRHADAWEVELDGIAQPFLVTVRDQTVASQRAAVDEFVAETPDEQLTADNRPALSTALASKLQGINQRGVARLAAFPRSVSDKMLISFAGVGVLVLVLVTIATAFLYVNGKQSGAHPTEPGGLVRGTIRSSLALMITAVTLTLGIFAFFVNYSVDAYLAGGLGAVVTFYFGTRAIEAFYRQKSTRRTTRTLVDGTVEEVSGAFAIVYGRIVDDAGAAVAHAQVSVRGQPIARSDADGMFLVELDGAGTLSFSANGKADVVHAVGDSGVRLVPVVMQAAAP